MRRHLLLTELLACGVAFGGSDGGTPSGLVRVNVGQEIFVDGQAPFPSTVKVAVLEGDPKGPGHFTVRVKFPKGFVLPLHTHPVDERSTVISGTVYVGTSEGADKAKGIKLEAGAFYVNPKDVTHWFIAETEVVLQISTDGPWGVRKVQ